MSGTTVHVIPLLVGLVMLAAMVWLVVLGVRRYRRHLRRNS
jgi:hypothetical protein